MAGRVKYLVFGVGMLVLAAGVSLSLWLYLARSDSEDTTVAGNGAPSLSQSLAQAMGLSEEEADELAERLQVAAQTGRGDASPGEETSLAQALAQAMGLSEEEADELAERLQAAVELAGAAATTGAETSLAQALEQALDLSEEEAGELAERLQAAVEQAGAVAPTGGSAPGGVGERAGLGDSIEFEVRDASGKLKQRGSTR